MQPLVASSIFNAQEAMLNHDEEDVLDDAIKLGGGEVRLTLSRKR
jgi:hypothetical protein